MATFRIVSSFGLVALLAACSSASDRTGFGGDDAGTPSSKPAPTGDLTKGNPTTPPASSDDAEVHEVYGQSATTLYKLEPATKAVTVVGNFSGCEPVTDIALDEKSTIYAVSQNTLYTVDKTTAVCTKVRSGTYPNSLSFVPKGTVDPNAEALVGYNAGDYIRIDVTTGQTTTLGSIGGSYQSSGDIVSVKGGKTYLTVKGGKCTTNDCLIEVDPSTGKLVQDWGSIQHKSVFGLSFWGGSLYGFDEQGELFQVTFNTNDVSTSSIPIPQKPSNLSFWGAGSSTSAPLVAQPQ